MDPKAAPNLHPDLQAKLDRVMGTPTNPNAAPVSPEKLLSTPPAPVSPPTLEDMLVKKQDANSLRMPPGITPPHPLTVSHPVQPAEHSEPAPAVQMQPTPMEQPVSTQSVAKPKSKLMPIFVTLGLILFFAGYTVMWMRLLGK